MAEKYTTCAGKIDEYQSEFLGSSQRDGADDIDSLFPNGEQVAIVVRNKESVDHPTLIVCEAGVLVSGENTMDVDVMIDRLQNCMREAEYDFTTNPIE